MSECNCIIEKLLKKSFSSRNLDEKIGIIERGRPMPTLNITTVIKRCKRHFSTKSYDTHKWLAGCIATEKLYCWSCLLFCNIKSIWTTTGFDDMNNLTNSAKKHKETGCHLASIVSLKMFERTRVKNDLDTTGTCSISIEDYNEKVARNRNVMKCLIDVTCHLACQGLDFSGDIEFDALNKGNFVETINLLASYNPLLKSHLENEKIFLKLYGDIQNGLISSIAFVLMDEIKKEISNADYLAIILNETTDVANKSHLSIMFRYVDNRGKALERFMEFVDASLYNSSQAVFDFIIPYLQKHDWLSKLICHSYDTAVTSSENTNDLLQTKIKKIAPQAHFIHSFAHKSNLVFTNSCSKIKHCAGFFKSLHSFANFFNHSSKRLVALNILINKTNSTICSTRWEYNESIVQTIFHGKRILEEFFEDIIANDKNWDSETILKAKGLLHILNDKKFIILLYFFNEFFPQTDILFKVLQCKSTDIPSCLNDISIFKLRIKNGVKNFESFWSNIERKENLERLDEHTCSNENLNTKEEYKILLNDIVKQLIEEMNNRFGSLPFFEFLELSHILKYKEFDKTFPDNLLSNLKESYPDLFDIAALKAELKVLFSDNNFSTQKNIKEITEFLVDNELNDCFIQYYKLCKLMLTLPITSASADWSSSCLSRMKRNLRNKCEQFRLSNLAFISIEKELLKKLKSKNDFHDKVIDNFILDEHRIDLIYRE